MQDGSAKAQLRLFYSTGFGDCIAVGLPEREAFLETAQHRPLLGLRRGVVDDHGIGIVAVAGFDQLVCANQIHGIERQAVVFYQRVALDDRFNFFGGLGLGGIGDFGAILHAAFYEDSQGRCSDDPISVIRGTVQPGSVAPAGWQETDVLKILGRPPKTCHHRQEQFRMRFPQRKPTGVFFVNIIGEHAADWERGILPVNAREEHGKVAHVDAVFLLKVALELIDADRSIGECRPGPMVFAVHQTQEFLLKSAFRHGTCHVCCLPDEWLVTIRWRGGCLMNQVTIQNPEDILSMLAEVSLRGSGFVTDCLLDYVLEEGFTEPIFLNASGEDPDAYFKGQAPAWAVYQIREWKRVLTVSGGPGKQRRVQITETP